MLGVSFFEGNDDDGWKNDGLKWLEHSESETYSIYNENYTKYDDKGNVLKDIYVVFGEILNEEIDKVEFANQDSEDFKKSKDHQERR